MATQQIGHYDTSSFHQPARTRSSCGLAISYPPPIPDTRFFPGRKISDLQPRPTYTLIQNYDRFARFYPSYRIFVAVSRSSLNRKLRATIGVSPAEFLRESRLKRAESHLLTTDLPVKEIAYSCGFSDLNYFGKCFKASTALTPSAYRAAHTEKTDIIRNPSSSKE